MNRSWWRSPHWMWMDERIVSSRAAGALCKPFFYNYTHVPCYREEVPFKYHFTQMTHFNCTISQFSAKLILFPHTSSSHSNSPSFSSQMPLTLELQIRPKSPPGSQITAHAGSYWWWGRRVKALVRVRLLQVKDFNVALLPTAFLMAINIAVWKG